ncbi:L-tyrosine decarboxylase [Fusarium austroafricanum]|uniref:L-tyrosine decarboxylase n=1 Tax=Fusarium austroafricanum TaxID=2364996 RepID=A0A8H4KV10_9HYPO|nr:L-tyrosine decarboxylase [Fusarium austroafricanum]
MYNPNNVATEASPYNIDVERKAGEELWEMLGYGHGLGDEESRVDPWGHITCDGSVANLEAICIYLQGDEKPFIELSIWELLNLKPTTILEIPTRLTEDYLISASFLQTAMKDYLISTIGKEHVDWQSRITNPAKFFGIPSSGSFFCHSLWCCMGGYFASMIDHEAYCYPPGEIPFVPTLELQEYTEEQLMFLPVADTITIDPHKSGYINYPAGGLCYRDKSMRYLITWTSPIVYYQGDDKGSMGVYGVKGSKPGAAAVATWLTHQTLGLDKNGYGRLLGEAIFTCTKLYCHWTTLTKPDDDLIVVPLIRPPTERSRGSKEDIEKEKERIRKEILGTLGGDLMINAFAYNFSIYSKPNTDIGEANYLNQQTSKRLSYAQEDDPTPISERPLFLTSSSFSEKAFTICLTNLKRRLELSSDENPAHGDLQFLVNVMMSPWPTDSPFLHSLVASFRTIVEEEVKKVIARNTEKPDIHGFVMQGLDKIHLVHVPMLNMAAHRWQNPDKFYTFANVAPEKLGDLLNSSGDVEFRMDDGIPGDGVEPLAKFKLSHIHVVVKRMPFYLYGSNAEVHVDHVLRTSPNAQLSGGCVKLKVEPAITHEQLGEGIVAVFEDVFENSIHPLPRVEVEDSKDKAVKLDAAGLSLIPGHKHEVSLYSTYEDFLGGLNQLQKVI